jgi:protein AroM
MVYTLKKIGVITIGQSPRPDITCDLERYLPKDVEIFEAGVLDGLSCEYVEREMVPGENSIVYVSRMADGYQVKLAKDRIIPTIQKRINQLEERGADIIVIFCTGDFPQFDAKVLLIYAGEVIKGLVSGVRYKGRVGILVPLEEQINYAREKWRSNFRDLIILHASPYTSTESEFRTIAERFKESGAKLIIMDCMGYTFQQKRIVKEEASVPVLSSRGVLIRFLNEFLTK